ncbi:hypothetical protein M408DRAFT_10411 [Serendipita vermifera MAFF 305830]|uniref:Fungal-type protein kinase domain-containing protein n=1 Tax=Serendipita vermifera MAFF 305830 TaxID=933852 RepID=A0A0C2X7Y2_SERVB|nr:hypothetical protein M408DRAFT_10411 [Serendipita vermifera MAFF 305830]
MSTLDGENRMPYDFLDPKIPTGSSKSHNSREISHPITTRELSPVLNPSPFHLYGNKNNNSSVFEQGDYRLQSLERYPGEDIIFANGRSRSLEVGETLVIKESWPFESRSDIEWSALTACTKAFGLPEIVFKVTGSHPISSPCLTERRIPTQIAMKELGVSLEEAKSPRILMIALIHCVVGHLNLFKQGWLHQDISSGNVLLLVDPVARTPPSG